MNPDANLEVGRIILVIAASLCLVPLVLTLSRTLALPYKPGKPWPVRTSWLAVALMLIAFVFVALKEQSLVSVALMMVFIAALTVLALLDARLKILPNKLTLPLLGIGVLVSLTGYTVGWQQSLIGATSGFLMLYLPALLFSKISGREGVGYGDFKLMAAVGAWLGWQPLLFIIMVAGISVAIVGSIYLKVNNLPRSTVIPFGPFLVAASVVACVM